MGGGSGTKNNPIALLTNNSRKCKKNAHNPLSGHSESNCWTLHPECRPAHLPKTGGSCTEATVSSFHTSLTQSSSQFILDSGSLAHMFSNPDLFCALERKKLGVVHMSSGEESLKIERTGTIRLVNDFGEIIFNQVLLVPDLVVNLLSVWCLILDNYQVLFLKNSFEIYKNENLKAQGLYVGNLPSLNFENFVSSCHLSSAKLLHKSLGHVSYSRLRKNLGLPLKIEKSCESCAITRLG